MVSPPAASDRLQLRLSVGGEALRVAGFWLRGVLPPRVLGGMLGQPKRSLQEA